MCVCVCVCGGHREASLGIEISLLRSSILVNLCSENIIACLYLNPRAQFYFNNMLMWNMISLCVTWGVMWSQKFWMQQEFVI